ncbi:MAG: hypothetical protein HZB99_03855 [Candidatus Harrisonbacteria bacterium]|nr:hypothetical protein [Candidatus Harrisonbacteria bacterium]
MKSMRAFLKSAKHLAQLYFLSVLITLVCPAGALLIFLLPISWAETVIVLFSMSLAVFIMILIWKYSIALKACVGQKKLAEAASQIRLYMGILGLILFFGGIPISFFIFGGGFFEGFLLMAIGEVIAGSVFNPC